MASPDNTDANTLFGWLFAVMSSYADERRLGEVFGSRVAFRLGDLGSPEPDIAFLRAENAARIRPGYVEGPPDLAVEIVSPESVERDYVAKRHQYQQARVPEYWILDEENTAVLLLRLDARGRYREARPRQGVLYSRVLEDFWLRPAWLWQSPRPSRFGVVQQLLAGGPGE
jgi:Uma2 family endonuclease